MTKKNISNSIFIILLGILTPLYFFTTTPARANPAPYFKLVATQGQGVGSNEFYVGRCIRVDIYLNTGGRNTNGADVEISYDNNILTPVQSNCSTIATSVYTDGLYNVYPSQGNNISEDTIILSAYNNPGNSTNVSNGLYGHLFFTILNASSSHNLTFLYTQGLTTDTNLAETGGDGSDILLSVENLTLSLLEDTDSPIINTQSPSSGATGVAINSNISFKLYDSMSGINNSSVTAQMKKNEGSYYAQTVSTGSSQVTNQNRYYQYTASISPNSNIKTNSGYYQYATTYTVSSSVSDRGVATPHTTTSVWSFTTEDDTTAPYTTNIMPADGSSGISIYSNISVRIKDYKNNSGVIPGLGIDSSSVKIKITSESAGEILYTCDSITVTCDLSNLNNILVTIDPEDDFIENENITIAINARDQHNTSPNVMNTSTYTFTTEDTAGPTISNISPIPNSTGNATNTPISFHINDNGTGVAIETLSIYINDTIYDITDDEVLVSGDSNEYTITITPSDEFENDRAVVVRVYISDLSSPANTIYPNPYLFTFIVGLETQDQEPCPQTSCPICDPTPTCSGGGGSVLYIEKECPKIKPKEIIIFKEKICEKDNKLENFVDSTTESKTYTQTKKQNYETQNLFSGGLFLLADMIGIDGFSAYDSSVIDIRSLGEKIYILQINKKLPDKDNTLLLDTNDGINIMGYTDAKQYSTIPILLYPPENSSKNDTFPKILYTQNNKEGTWNIALNGPFEPGRYTLKSFVRDTSKENSFKSVNLANIDFLDETEILIPEHTTENYDTRKKIFDIKSIVIFASIVGISTFAIILGGATGTNMFGLATIFLLAILGTAMSFSNPPTTKIVLKNSPNTDLYARTENQQELAIKAYETYKKEQETSHEYFTGRIFNPITKKPIHGALVETENSNATTDENGYFILRQVTSENILKLNIPELTNPMYAKIGNSSNVEFKIMPELIKTLALVEKYNSQRKYSSIYEYATEEIKAYIPKDTFIQDKNTDLFERLKIMRVARASFSLASTDILDTWYSKTLKKEFKKVAKATFVYEGISDTKGITHVEEPWYFVEENGEWKFVK